MKISSKRSALCGLLVLAFGVLKSPAAAPSAAVFGPWSAITASVLASWWRRRLPEESTAVQN